MDQVEKVLKTKKRNDATRRFVIKRLIKNDRLKTYELYIKLAQRLGYKVCCMKEFYDEKDNEKKHFVLRHDVDNVTIATEKMFDLERKLGVTSTYYFRFSTFDKNLVSKMIKAGFEVGLHYETIADYAKYYRCTSIEQVDMKEVKEKLKADIEIFNSWCGKKTVSCASHGHSLNSLWKCSNNIIFEDSEPTELGVVFEAYDKDMYEKYVDCHIMDGPLRVNCGFSYQTNPIQAMLSEKRNIIFLAHPMHWDGTRNEQLFKIGGAMMHGISVSTDRKFLRTY